MMLSASPFYAHSLYTPSRPSPLSERSANVLPRAFSFTMASQPQNEKEPVPQRPHKPNPAIQSRDVRTQRRRDMFFRRVQKDRDDRKWEARGEQIQHLDWVSDQKRWEAQKARQAPELEEGFIDEESAEIDESNYESSSAPQPGQEYEMSEADYILEQEQHELNELIALMDEDHTPPEENASQNYGSDDEDYDQIFMECTPDTQAQQLPYAADTGCQDTDAMDTEMTDG